MTIAEQLIQKGKFEGIAKGRVKGETAMLIRLSKVKFMKNISSV